MKIINPEFEIAKVISKETERLFNEGYVLTRFERGGFLAKMLKQCFWKTSLKELNPRKNFFIK